MKVGLIIALFATGSGCGYHVSGKGDFLPKNVQTIAIPAFTNITARYKLPEKLASALTREFISRTRYQMACSTPRVATS